MKTLHGIHGSLRFNHIVATGGIGTGMFFSIRGNETLGRNESRLADLMPYKDFCKQHIILHYIAVLLGGNENFFLYPIGCVGADDAGRELTAMMKSVGMDTSFVSTTNLPTTFSVCFQYPDKSGGNITSAQSASGSVTEKNVNHFFSSLSRELKAGIALAVPEVPLAARVALLHETRKRSYFNAASVLASETEEFIERGGVELSDLMAVNLEEAHHIARLTPANEGNSEIAERCSARLKQINPNIRVLVTCGSSGVFYIGDEGMQFTPAMVVQAASTAGAGDAFLSGFLVGLCCGLPPAKISRDKTFGETPLASAIELGTLLASMSVLSPHTINEQVSAATIHQFIEDHKLEMEPFFLSLFNQTT